MTDFALFGAIVNAALVIVGSAVGVAVKAVTGGKNTGERGKRISDAVFFALGLCVLLIGITGAIKGAVNDSIKGAVTVDGLLGNIAGENILVIIISMVLGTILGELIDLDKGINKLGDKIQDAMKGRGGNVAQGFVSASLLFCVGSMAIVGALNSGISGDHTMQITKGVIDMFAAVVLASTMGIGVMFSAIFVLLYQGAITLLAEYVGGYLTPDVIMCMSSTGSLLIIALALNMLGITKTKVMNYVPAVFFPIALIPLYDWLAQIIGNIV